MPQHNTKKANRRELETVQGMFVAFKEAVEESLDQLAAGNHAGMPANEIAMWAAHMTIAYYVAERFVQDCQHRLDQLEAEKDGAYLYVPEGKIIA